MANKPTTIAGFKIGDRVRLLRLDGSVGSEVVTIHDLWSDETNNRNASFIYAGCEQFTHTDLIKHEADTSPVVVPDGGEWFIARGSNMGWGRAQTIERAVSNMKLQGGKVSSYVVHRVSKWTQVDDMGSLSYPSGIAPVEVKVVKKGEGGMITIKAWTNANREIQWNYDNPQQAAPVWKKIEETGRTPDTSEGLSRAYYWGAARKPGEGPDKVWVP